MKRCLHSSYFVLALGSATYLYPFLRVLWRVGDEGTLVYGAQRVAEGAVPYRDFFEVMGPGTFYWLALFFKIFGSTWLVARASLLFTMVATTLLLYWLARRLRMQAAALPAVFMLVITIPLWPATNHHWDSNLFFLLSFGAFLCWLDDSRRWLLISAGILAGVTTCFIQQKGVLLLAAYLLITLILRGRQHRYISTVVWLICSYLGVLAVVILLFAAGHALPEFYYANLVWPLSNYHNVNTVPYGFGLHDWYWGNWVTLLTPVSSLAAARIIAGILLLPLLVITTLPALTGVLALAKRSVSFNPTTIPYWIAGSALWLSEIHRADVPHLIYGSPLLLILCIYLWQQRGAFWHYGARALLSSFVLLAAFTVLIAQAAQTRVTTRRGTIYTFTRDSALDFLDQQVTTGQEIFVYPYYPMYYFLSATRNATRFSILMYHINTTAQFREAMADLERRKARYVLWDTAVEGQNLKQWFPGYEHPRREELLIEPYLKEHYDLVGYKDSFRVLVRRDEASVAGNGMRAAFPGSEMERQLMLR